MKHKYVEKYKNKEIIIFRSSAEWWWKITYENKVRNSSQGYFSLDVALNEARKYIDKREI